MKRHNNYKAVRINMIIHHSIIQHWTHCAINKHDRHLELHYANDTTLNKEKNHSIAVIN